MLSTKDIAIVILNWNGKTLLEQFLPSVVAHSNDAQIYVADNASTDASKRIITEDFPTVKYIQNSENGGYAKGYNDALEHIREPIFCLLNNDIEVTKQWLQPIIEAYNGTPDLTIVQPKILDYKQKTHFEYAGAAGGFIDKYGYPFCRGRLFNTIEKDTGQYNDTKPIFWASGACLFIKNTAFKKLEGFDASFFAHMEEIDLCWRAFNNGYTATYVGASRVYHLGGATLSNTSPKKTYLNFRNNLFMLVRNLPSGLFKIIFIRMLLDGLAAIRCLAQLQPSHFLAILKAHFSFYASLPRLLKQRKFLPKRKNYYERKSIVWSYFVNKKRHY